jgi:hypothetical protein
MFSVDFERSSAAIVSAKAVVSGGSAARMLSVERERKEWRLIRWRSVWKRASSSHPQR